jgi:hypothetical protein
MRDPRPLAPPPSVVERSQRRIERLVPLRELAVDRMKGPAFAPYAPWLARFSACVSFPDADALNDALASTLDDALGAGAIRFEPQRRKRRLRSLEDAYEARIDARGRIPTRACLHDFMNALVWARFPRSKRALARRQHAALRRDVPFFSGTLPSRRSEERDVLAMLDEGGVIFASSQVLVLGHAILEHLASSDDDVLGMPLSLEAPGDASIDAIDRALAREITESEALASRGGRRAVAVRALFASGSTGP